MTERPILMSAPNVRAILDGRKSQTRRAMTSQPDKDGKVTIGTSRGIAYVINERSGGILTRIPCPYGIPGNTLWVRETFSDDWHDRGEPVHYRADGDLPIEMFDAGVRWRSPIHMPRSASRITLEITDIRVQRLHEITEEDAKAEGVSEVFKYGMPDGRARDCFRALWDSINGKRVPWEGNPFVWVISFRPTAGEAV